MPAKKRATKFRKWEACAPIPGLSGEIGPAKARAWFGGLPERLSLLAAVTFHAEAQAERSVVNAFTCSLRDGVEACLYCITKDEAAAVTGGEDALEDARAVSVLLELCSRCTDEIDGSPALKELHSLMRDLLAKAAKEAA